VEADCVFVVGSVDCAFVVGAEFVWPVALLFAALPIA
jgi:hypothetical protein